MNTTDILTEIQNVLAGNEPIDAWCRNHFDRAPLVYLGMDEENPPEPEHYPVIAIAGVTQTRSDSKREIAWEIELGIGIYQEEIQKSGNKVTHSGFLQAEELRELTENALYQSFMPNIASTGEASSVSYHPLYVSYTTITFTQKRSAMCGISGGE